MAIGGFFKKIGKGVKGVGKVVALVAPMLMTRSTQPQVGNTGLASLATRDLGTDFLSLIDNTQSIIQQRLIVINGLIANENTLPASVFSEQLIAVVTDIDTATTTLASDVTSLFANPDGLNDIGTGSAWDNAAHDLGALADELDAAFSDVEKVLDKHPGLGETLKPVADSIANDFKDIADAIGRFFAVIQLPSDNGSIQIGDGVA